MNSRLSNRSAFFSHIKYLMPAVPWIWLQPESFLKCLPFLSLLVFPVCCMSIVYLLTNRGTRDKCEALQESFSHKQIISRYIASADLASVTAPGHRVWPVPCLPEVQLALPVKSAQPLSPGNRLRGHLSFWINGHTCTPTCPQSCHTGRREGKRERERERESRTHPGWLMTWFWMNGWVCIAWFREMWLRLTDLREACVPWIFGNNDWYCFCLPVFRTESIHSIYLACTKLRLCSD